MQIDENKRPRTALKSYFAKNSIPTEGQFSQLIDSAINQRDDGLVKGPGDPLSIEATGDDVGLKRAVNFYMSFADANPAWTISLRPRRKPSDANTGRPGWSISDSDNNSRLCIDAANGNVGIGTVAPAEKLEVTGRVRAGEAGIGPWPPNAQFSYFGSSGLNQSNSGNYALLQDNSDGRTMVNSPASVHLRIGNADRMTVRDDGVTVVGSLKITGSDLYFTETDHRHTGAGNAQGHAAIENASDYGALMILGRTTPAGRIVKTWDYLEVNGRFNSNGDMAIHGKHAFRGNDGWLRLNQDGAFPHGTHTPRLFAPMSLNVGGAIRWEHDPGAGNIIYAGRLSKLDVGPEFTATIRCADFTIGGHPGRRASPGRALVDDTNQLVLNYAADWPKMYIDGETRIPKLVQPSSGALKKDIRPMTGAEAKAIVDALDPVSFRWKGDNEATRLGFIAEDCPDAVTTTDRDAIFVSHIVAALTRVVRDQAKTIAALERRVDSMKVQPA
jgi:hypothetical protein